MAPPPPYIPDILPPYVPTPKIIASSRLTAPELVSHFEDFSNTLRYVSTAPELVFERLVGSLSDSFMATLQLGLEEHPNALQASQLSIEKLTAEWEENSSALEASHLANEKLEAALQESSSVRQATQLVNEKLMAELATLKENIQNPVPSMPVAEKAVAITNPVIGACHTREIRRWSDVRHKTSKTISFAKAYTMIPGLVVGLTALDICREGTARVYVHASKIQRDRFEINMDSWGDTKLYVAGCAWLEIEADDKDFQYGTYCIREDHDGNHYPIKNTRKIIFKRAYLAAPKLVVWLSKIDIGHSGSWRVKSFATDVTATGFTIHIDSWLDSRLYCAVASWVAYPVDRPGVASGCFSTLDVRSCAQPQVYNSAFEAFETGLFEKSPRILVALNALDIGRGQDLRLQVKVDNVSAAGMTWHLDAWNDTVVYSAGASYIALC